jgi:thymidine kinase
LNNKNIKNNKNNINNIKNNMGIINSIDMSNKSLELIVGPMFSGKTTLLIEKYNEVVNKGEKCLAINYALDKRYGENQIITHDGTAIDCLSIMNLDELHENEYYNKKIEQCEYIFINEAQFFTGLKDWVINILNTSSVANIILCGLDLDFKREKFGELMDLESYATRCYRLSGECNTLSCIFPSAYSYRITANTEQVYIGLSEYVPLCEKCYNETTMLNDDDYLYNQI